MISTLERMIPQPIKRRLKGPYVEVRSRVRIRRLLARLRSQYGPDLLLTIHPDDEMFHFIRDEWKWPFHVEKMEGPADAFHTYLVSGDGMVANLRAALAQEGRELSDATAFLEFASGYGRFTRFLVTQVPADRVTVSDISAGAVEFACETYGVTGVVSAARPEDLDIDGQFDVIFVASLFSHLNHAVWVPWLRRLAGLLSPGGLLLFSTHGDFARTEIFGPHAADRMVEHECGFWYLLTNETGGRLDEDYYGTSFVTVEWVTRQIEANRLGKLLRVHRTLLWGSQDLYVVERSIVQ